ncbi:hypothetical protein HZ326_5229 [Fusarium oxysporum f. sp. albedinis]|nr:hypothetical protein HZ326_5229 [Fusarium oxysporum f. sp. albedinis]
MPTPKSIIHLRKWIEYDKQKLPNRETSRVVCNAIRTMTYRRCMVQGFSLQSNLPRFGRYSPCWQFLAKGPLVLQID